MGKKGQNLVNAQDGVNGLSAIDFNNAVRENTDAIFEGQPGIADPSGNPTYGSSNETGARLANFALMRANIFTITGSSNAYIATTNSSYALVGIKFLQNGLRINIIANHTNTGASTINLDTLGVKDIKQIDGTALASGMMVANKEYTLLYNGTYFYLINPTVAASIAQPRLFAVNNAKVDSNGYANFSQKDSNTQITVLAGGSNPNLALTAYDGTSVTLTSDVVKSGLSTDGTFIMIYNLETASVDVISSSILTEGYASPSGGSDGDYYVRKNPLITYKKVSGTWTAYKFVKLNQFTRSGGVIGTITDYALNAQYFATASIDLANLTTLNHNIGGDIRAECFLECTVANNGYSVGDRTIPFSYNDNQYERSGLFFNSLQIGYVPGAGSVTQIGALSKATKLQFEISSAQWKYVFIANRNY